MVLTVINGIVGNDAIQKVVKTGPNVGADYIEFSLYPLGKSDKSERCYYIIRMSKREKLLPYIKKGCRLCVVGRVQMGICQNSEGANVIYGSMWNPMCIDFLSPSSTPNKIEGQESDEASNSDKGPAQDLGAIENPFVETGDVEPLLDIPDVPLLDYWDYAD